MKITGEVVAAEFVPPGDPHREDKEDDPRLPGTYVTILIDEGAAVGAGKVVVEWLTATAANK